MLTLRKSAEFHVLSASTCLVMTRDVVSFALVTSDSFPVKSMSVFVLVDTV